MSDLEPPIGQLVVVVLVLVDLVGRVGSEFSRCVVRLPSGLRDHSTHTFSESSRGQLSKYRQNYK